MADHPFPADSDLTGKGGGNVAPVRYRIRVRGRLTERLGSAFGGMTLEPAPGQTVLVGEIVDQSHLFGVLDRVRSLGLELISVEPSPADQASGQGPQKAETITEERLTP
jgi:hypothetical protein